MSERKRRRQIKNYFIKPSLKRVLGIMIMGALLFFFDLPTLAILVILSGAVWGLLILFYRVTSPSDKNIDLWLHQDIVNLIQLGLNKVGIDATELVKEPVIIKGPVVWHTPGIPNEELLWKKGKDKIARFAIYRVTIIYLTEHHLGSYACDFNFMRNVALNEQTVEYHYNNIVGVGFKEGAQSYTLPTGQKLVNSQSFRLSVSSGESVQVVVSAQQLKDLTNAEIPSTEVERAIRVIRTMLRAKAPFA